MKTHYYYRKKQGLPGRIPILEAREIMGITGKLTAKQVGEAVPPAYAKLLAEYAIAHLHRIRNTQISQTLTPA